jgi:hypothetical protein
MTVTSEPTGAATQNQAITSIQSASASADASQVAPSNLVIWTGGILKGVKQVNQVTAASTAGAFDTANQTLVQQQTGTDDGAIHSVDSTQLIGTVQSATSDAVAGQAHASNLAHVWSQATGNQATIGRISQKNEAVAPSFAAVESITSQSAGQYQTGGGANQTAEAIQQALTTQQNVASAHVAQARVANIADLEIPWNGLYNPPINQSNTVSAVSSSTSYSEITQTLVQEASGEGIDWELHGQQTAIVKQSGSAWSGASQSNIVNVAHWTGTLVTPPGVTGQEVGSSFQAAVPSPPATPLIIGTPPVSLPGLVADSVQLSGVSAAKIVVTAHGPRVLGVAGVATAPRAATTSGRTAAADRYVHMLFNLLGAGSSALVLLLGATPFAALLALFMIAAVGVARSQYVVPALGRSVDFARHERPG